MRWEEEMEEQAVTWVRPGRITSIEEMQSGRRLVSIACPGAMFAAVDLGERGVIRDLVLQGGMINHDTGEEVFVVGLDVLPEYVRVGMPVLVQADDEDEFAIHLHPDPLHREPYLPSALHLVCPAEQVGRWCSLVEDSVYECPCGATWEVLPEEDG